MYIRHRYTPIPDMKRRSDTARGKKEKSDPCTRCYFRCGEFYTQDNLLRKRVRYSEKIQFLLPELHLPCLQAPAAYFPHCYRHQTDIDSSEENMRQALAGM